MNSHLDPEIWANLTKFVQINDHYLDQFIII